MYWNAVCHLFFPYLILILTWYSLARSEILLVISTVLRRMNFELFETTIEDVRVKHDIFIPFVNMDSKGVRVLIKD